jgi:hypothetical protein
LLTLYVVGLAVADDKELTVHNHLDSLAFNSGVADTRTLVGSDIDAAVVPAFATLLVRTEVNGLLASVGGSYNEVAASVSREPSGDNIAKHIHNLNVVTFGEGHVEHELYRVLQIRSKLLLCLQVSNIPTFHAANLTDEVEAVSERRLYYRLCGRSEGHIVYNDC